jgi:hypothetical protein
MTNHSISAVQLIAKLSHFHRTRFYLGALVSVFGQEKLLQHVQHLEREMGKNWTMTADYVHWRV